MQRLLGVGLVAMLAVGCDSDSNGDGGGSGSSSSESTDTSPTGQDTLTTSTPTTAGSTGGSTTSGSSTTDTSPTTSDGTTTTDGDTEGETDGASSSSTGEPNDVTPCQPEMSKAAISAWRLDADSRMPSFADIAVTVPDFQLSPPSFEGPDGLSGLPQQGGGGFITDPDGGGVNVECDIWAQDCDEGEKCAPWANDGGSAWNATRCVPVDVDPVGVGETCVVEGSGVSGIDTCDFGSMCWDVDAETNEGTCVALCEGSPEAPTCAPEGTACSIANQGVLILCLPICNPLADECGDGEGCYSVGDAFHCAPDASGDGGGAGEPCEFVNACEDGLLCLSGDTVPGCNADACCTPTCEDGDDTACPDGQSCVPFFDRSTPAPAMCLEGVGACIGR